MIIQLAWKNMLRYKKRSLITASAIAIGIIFSIFIDCLMFGIDQESSLNLINYETSACRIYASGYFEEKQTYPINYLLTTAQQKSIETWMQQNYSNINYTPRFVSSCEIFFTNEETNIDGSVRAILNGIQSDKDATVFNLPIAISSGRWIRTSKEALSEETVLGSALADDLGIKVGDWITIRAKGLGGFEQTIDVEVTGIIKTTDPVINSNTIYMDYQFVNQMLELNGAITEYDFYLGILGKIEKRYQLFKTDFQNFFSPSSSGVELYFWRELAADILTLTETKKSASGIMVFFMFVIAAVGITNTILMSVMERKREIAMLRTLGYSTHYIQTLFILEGINIGILGAAAGILLSIPINWYFVTYGWDLSLLTKDMDIGFRISSIMKSGWNYKSFFTIPLGALLITAISAWIPTHSLLKKQVASIFRSI